MFIAYLGKGKLKLNIHLDYVPIHINSEKCIIFFLNQYYGDFIFVEFGVHICEKFNNIVGLQSRSCFVIELRYESSSLKTTEQLCDEEPLKTTEQLFDEEQE